MKKFETWSGWEKFQEKKSSVSITGSARVKIWATAYRVKTDRFRDVCYWSRWHPHRKMSTNVLSVFSYCWIHIFNKSKSSPVCLRRPKCRVVRSNLNIDARTPARGEEKLDIHASHTSSKIGESRKYTPTFLSSSQSFSRDFFLF